MTRSLPRFLGLGTVLALLFSLPLWVWITVEGNPLEYLTHDVPGGQALYVLTKLIGLYVFFLLWLHVLWVTLKQTPVSRYLPRWLLKYHQTTAILLALMIVTHVALFVTAVSLRNETFAYTLLIPNFSDYYHSLVGLGVVAFWLLPVIIYAGLKSKQNKNKHRLHYLAYLFFVLIFFHGFGVGSETKSGVMLWVYLGMGISVVAAMIYRHSANKALNQNQVTTGRSS